MEGIVARRMTLSLMVLVMVVVAQGRSEAGFNPAAAQTGHCAKKCGLRCALRIFPARVVLCLGLCMLRCKLQPPAPVYQCTSNCAHSMVNTYNPTVAENVEDMVGSCYETCKQNNNA